MDILEGVVPAIANALTKRGYSTLTPVQTAMLDPNLLGKDALVSAQTGSGKTVAFGLGLAPTLLGQKEKFGSAAEPLALIVAPTRELALQVKRELEWLYEMTNALFASCVGGMDMRTEKRSLERGAHIVVGTPGRLRDHITRKSLDMSRIRAIVLDEADEMLDLGFREDLEFILESAPEDRRTLMFSATVPKAIAKLAESYQRDAVRIASTSEQKQHVDIEYKAFVVAQSDRENAIINVLRYHEAQTAIVFCSTRAAVNHMTARLNNRGFSVVALSGELSQNERTHALQAVRDGRARVLIATDVAARGIDLPNLELVIHADLPTNPDTLLHRSGRTGRAGRKGTSVLVVPTAARRKAERILGAANVKASWERPPSADDITRRDNERLLADALLENAPAEDEIDVVTELLSLHGPEKVAAAFIRLYRGKRSAPEDLVEVAMTPGKAGEPPKGLMPRDDFKDGRWFSLSAGRRQSAEPRWIIPMLCRIGGITKREIGAIRMREEETFVEISGDCVERFTAAIGSKGALEGGMTIRAVEGKPDMEQIRYDKPAEGAEMPKRERWPLHDKAKVRTERDGERAPRSDRDKGAPRGPRNDREWTPKPERAPYKAPKTELDALDRDVWALGKDKSAAPAAAAERTEPAKEKTWDKPKGDGYKGDGYKGDKPKTWDKPKGDKPFNKEKTWDKPRAAEGASDWSKPGYKGAVAPADRVPDGATAKPFKAKKPFRKDGPADGAGAPRGLTKKKPGKQNSKNRSE